MTHHDIGPYYRLLGVGLLLGALMSCGMLLAALVFKVAISDTGLKVAAWMTGMFLLAFAAVVVRPPVLDALFKNIVSALPWTKYQRPSDE